MKLLTFQGPLLDHGIAAPFEDEARQKFRASQRAREQGVPKEQYLSTKRGRTSQVNGSAPALGITIQNAINEKSRINVLPAKVANARQQATITGKQGEVILPGEVLLLSRKALSQRKGVFVQKQRKNVFVQGKEEIFA